VFKRIAAFGAHPDDLEIGCFGTLAKFIDKGAHVDLFLATGNKERLLEAKAASRCLGDGGWTFHKLRYENNQIPYSAEIIQDIDSRLDEIDPDLVITHWVGDNQQDHQNIAKAVISACRKRDTIWMMEPPMGRPPIDSVFRPQVYVDISEYLEVKKRSILKHNSQRDRLLIKENFNPWYYQSMIHGTSINTLAAEVFEVVKQTIRL
jgi:N-acetylglucosamine malate deacetylase 1